MFRIKTDIRHYRCDSRDKVERLIRNWVIRPADLIYDHEKERWHPIGKHPSFVELFDQLAEKHANEPDTVITDKVADKAAEDRPTNEDTRSNGKSNAPGSAVLRRAKSTSKKGQEKDADASTDASGEDAGSSQTEADATRPEPGEDVEGVYRDSDEITMMTERTLDLITVEKDSAASEENLDAEETTDVVDKRDVGADETTDEIAVEQKGDDSEETTDVVERSSVADEDVTDELEVQSRSEGEEETTDVVERASIDGEKKEKETTDVIDRSDVDEGEEETTNVVEKKSVEGEKSSSRAQTDPDEEDTDVTENPRLKEAPPSPGSKEVSQGAPVLEGGDSNSSGLEVRRPQRKPGRHNLPEEVFVTAEIDGRAEDGDEERLDELGALAEKSEPEESVMGSRREARSNWNIVLDEMPPPEDDEKVEAPGESAADEVDALRETADLDPSEIGGAVDPLEDTGEHEVDDAGVIDDSEPDDSSDESFTVDDDSLNEAFDELEESAIAARQRLEEDDGVYELEELPVLESLPADVENLGYELDLPITITPSRKARNLGIQRARKTRRTKDNLYPKPEPKTPGQLISNTYNLSEIYSFGRPTASRLLIRAAAIAVLVIVLALALVAGGFAISL